MRTLSLVTLIIISGCFGAEQIAQAPIPNGWQRIDADGYFAFYLPPSIHLLSTERCEECAWGSTYADDNIRLGAEYTHWNDGYSLEYLAKQPEYQKQITEIAGKKVTIQSWRSLEPTDGFAYIVEARFYGGDGKLVARMTALCKSQADMETAKQIFRTVGSFKS
jgi:hypothetical protein